MKIYKLVWDDFCSWYLEMVKPAYGQPIAKELYDATIIIFDSILRLLHPIMPFITEELWQELQTRKDGDSICIAEWPTTFNSPKVDADKALLLITEVRAFRNSKGISPKESVELYMITQNENDYKNFEGLIIKLANVSALNFTTEKIQGAYSFLINTDEAFIPVELDKDAESKRIAEEINYLEGFLKSVETKLSNERFMANAKPDVIEKELQKKSDAENKLATLKEQLGMLV